MHLIKRIFLFLAINILILFTISFLLTLFNIKPFLTAYGVDYYALLIFCFLWGFTGAFISLFLSRKMAIWLMGVKLINPQTQDAMEKYLIETVARFAKEEGLSPSIQVGIYQSDEINAFATGPTKNRSLIAISSALLSKMDRNEIKAIIGHEMSHISNGDMVTMTLLQGIVNAFVMFLARALAFLIMSGGRSKNSRSKSFMYYPLVFLFEIVFMLLGSLIVSAFSRRREYRADFGGAKLAGKQNMIAALTSLKSNQSIVDKTKQQPAFQNFKISSTPSKKLIYLFASHPPIDDRINRLKQLG